MNKYQAALNRLIEHRDDIYNLVAENAIGIFLLANKASLVDEKCIEEFRAELKSSAGGDFRYRFHIFTQPVLTLNDESYEKLTKQSHPEKSKPHKQIHIYRVEGVWKTLLGKFPPSEITQAIASILTISRVMPNAFKAAAHDEIDAGLLILVSASILRLIETSPSKVLSVTGEKEVSHLKEIAAEIFTDEFNFKDIYFPPNDDESPDESSADTSASEGAEVQQEKHTNLTLQRSDIVNAVRIVVKPILEKRMTDISHAVNTLATLQHRNQQKYDDLLVAVESNANQLLEKQTADISNVIKKDILTLLEKHSPNPVKDTTSSQNDHEVSATVMDAVTSLLESRMSDISDAVKKEVSELLEKQLSEISSLVKMRKFSETDYPYVDELTGDEFDDDISSGADEESPTFINYSQAKDKLYGLRNEIREKYELQIEPWKNILQGPFIIEMLDVSVKNLDDWKDAPKIKDRYQEYKDIMDAQLEEYWDEEIFPILARIEPT